MFDNMFLIQYWCFVTFSFYTITMRYIEYKLLFIIVLRTGYYRICFPINAPHLLTSYTHTPSKTARPSYRSSSHHSSFSPDGHTARCRSAVISAGYDCSLDHTSVCRMHICDTGSHLPSSYKPLPLLFKLLDKSCIPAFQSTHHICFHKILRCNKS